MRKTISYLSLAPSWGPGRHTGMCPDWESHQWPSGPQVGTQSTEPHHPGQYIRFLEICHVSENCAYCVAHPRKPASDRICSQIWYQDPILCCTILLSYLENRITRVKNTITFPLHTEKCLPHPTTACPAPPPPSLAFDHFFPEKRMWSIAIRTLSTEETYFPNWLEFFHWCTCWISLLVQECQSELVRTLNFKYPIGKALNFANTCSGSEFTVYKTTCSHKTNALNSLKECIFLKQVKHGSCHIIYTTNLSLG